ncbi:MAG: tetrathionate reductase family octaheme c-type cytochrome [Verrucomicrobiales bacterium]|nr:tetrathionate reductase family octaheme c-type cytochrome [Verrucomicrobiales bacterium]
MPRTGGARRRLTPPTLGPRATLTTLLGLAALAAIAVASPVARAAASHAFIPEYSGTQTCLRCHPNAAAEVMKTPHWTWEHTDPATGQKLGKKNVINNYCIAVPSNEPRCTSCHVGLGYSDKNFDFTDPNKVDCLICHDTTGTYKKFPTGAGMPVSGAPKEFPAGSGVMWPAPDLTHIARNVGNTSRDTCGACHFYGGGGDAVKHGDLDSTMFKPTRELDVHMGVDGANFSCSRCHGTRDHEMSGTSYPSGVADDRMCQQCHQTGPHASATLNTHAARVACQTCHIPAFARGGKATKMWWDWSKAGRKTADGKNIVTKDANGNPIYDTQKGEFVWESNVTPEYVWFNGNMTYVSLDDTLDPDAITPINRLHGDLNDSKARIFPVKRFQGKQPIDAGTKTLAVPHLFGSDTNAYWKAYDWNRSLAAGMQYIGRSYSGQLGFVSTEMFWIQNHMVAPKEQALGCVDCHAPGSRMNFAALGYPEARAASLQTLAGFTLGNLRREADGNGLRLEWSGKAGYAYQIQVSSDLKAWTSPTDGERRCESADADLNWSVSTSGADGSAMRFIRVVRSRIN